MTLSSYDKPAPEDEMARSKPAEKPLGVPLDEYVWVARSKARLGMAALLTVMIGMLALGIYLDATVGGQEPLVLTVGAAVMSVALWGGLQARIPQRVEIKRAVITVIRNGHRERYDLEDPGVELRVLDGRIAFAHYMKPWTVVRARDVDWPTFTHVVMHYQNNADTNASLRDQRFAR